MAFAPLKRYIAMSGSMGSICLQRCFFGDKSWGNRINTHRGTLVTNTETWLFNSLYQASACLTHTQGLWNAWHIQLSLFGPSMPFPSERPQKKIIAATCSNLKKYFAMFYRCTGFFVVFSSWTSLKVDPRGAIYWVSGGHVHASSSALKPPNLFERLVWGLGLGTALGEAAWFWWQKCEDILRTGKTACNIM